MVSSAMLRRACQLLPKSFASAAEASLTAVVLGAVYAPARGLKWSQKLALVLLRTSSAVGSRQCLATFVSYSMHMRQTCSSARHLHSSKRRRGRLSALKLAPHFQHTRS